MKILLLSGGNSAERTISLRSGDTIEQALKAIGYEVLRADPADTTYALEKIISQVDIVFPILHGAGGEDGTIQEQLELLKIPYLGSTAQTCRDTLNKVSYKKVIIARGIPTPRWEEVSRDSFKISELHQHPYVLKPTMGGSSIDTFIVRDPQSEPANLMDVFARYKTMLLEEYQAGQEITVGVLGDHALPVILIIPPLNKDFDYENKYNGTTQEIPNPSDIPQDIQQKAQELALTIHKALGCRHLSRTDMIIKPDGSLAVLETNTIPGLTEQSLFPKAAAAAGLDIGMLAKKLVWLVQHE